MRIYRTIQGYKAKRTPRPRNPDDPVWRGIVRIREERKQAMREAIETGTRYRDPYSKLQRSD